MPPVKPTKTNEPSSDRDGKSPANKRLILGTAVLGVSIFLVYHRSLGGSFVFDDASTIVENRSIRQLWPLVAFDGKTAPLSPPAGAAVSARPLVNLSLAVNYYFGELDPRGYRATQVVLHFLTALLLWSIVARTLRLEVLQEKFEPVVDWLSFASALIWAMHPVVTECVVYITQRTELMMGFFYLSTLYCALRYWSVSQTSSHRKIRAFWLALATVACVAGMLCKEMIASAPAVVLLFERTFVTRSFRRALSQSWPLYLGLALAWIPAIAMSYYGQRTPQTGFGLGVAAHEWWFTQTKVFFLYWKLAIWPWPLAIHYEIPHLKTIATAWPWLLAFGCYGIAAIAMLWRRPAVGFVMVCVVAVLSPTLVIPLIGETAGERRMYVPLAALVPFFIVGGYALLARSSIKTALIGDPKKIAVVVTAVLAIGFGLLSAQRTTAYQSELSLWQDAVDRQPNDPLVRANLGVSFTAAGKLPEAIPHFRAWVQLEPDSHWAHYNLARALEGTGQFEGAIKQYRLAIQHQPDHGASHYNLARLLEDNKKWIWAIKHYRLAIEAQPEFSAAHTNLAFLLQNRGDLPEAIKHFEAAMRIQEDLNNCASLTLALMQANRPTEAIAVGEKALLLAQEKGDTHVAEELEEILATLRIRQAAP